MNFDVTQMSSLCKHRFCSWPLSRLYKSWVLSLAKTYQRKVQYMLCTGVESSPVYSFRHLFCLKQKLGSHIHHTCFPVIRSAVQFSRFDSGHSVCLRFGTIDPWLESYIQQRKTTFSPFDSKIACLCHSIEIKNNKHAYHQSRVRKSTGIEVQLIMSNGFAWLIWYGIIGLAVVVENCLPVPEHRN